MLLVIVYVVDIILLALFKNVELRLEFLGILLVIVAIHYIGYARIMIPARRVYVHTGVIVRSRKCGKLFGESAIKLVGKRSFVEGTPSNNSGVVEISFQYLLPLHHKVGKRKISDVRHTPVGVLAPDDISASVTMLKEKRLEDLFVKSCAVETERHRHIDVVLQSLKRGRGVDSVGIEALIENKALEYRLAVEVHDSVSALHLAHAEIRGDLIVAESQLDIVKSSLSDLPKMKLVELDLKPCNVILNGRACLSHKFTVVACLCMNDSAACNSVRVYFGEKGLLFKAGIIFHVRNSDLGGRFEPDGLPDACGTRIQATEGLVSEALLARRLSFVTGIVLGTNNDGILSACKRFGYYKREADVSAAVIADMLTVYPDVRIIIAGADIENDVSALVEPAIRQGDLLFIPDRRAKILIADARKLTFAAERDYDLFVEAYTVEEVSIHTRLGLVG